jgi:hypothetical protein
LLGQPFGSLLSGDDRDATLRLLVESAGSVLNEPDHRCAEVIARRKDGTDIPVDVSLSAFAEVIEGLSSRQFAISRRAGRSHVNASS